MRYLTTCAFLLCMTAVNAETENTNSTPESALKSGDASMQQTMQSVARKLIPILGLTTVSSSEQQSISLKMVVTKALSEGKQMSEIRLATNQAVKEATGKVLTSTTSASAKPDTARGNSDVDQSKPAEITANPVEVSLDPETGKMVATVLPGESIFRLAQRVYGKENGRKYLEIYAANRDKIKNINVVTEGQILTMP